MRFPNLQRLLALFVLAVSGLGTAAEDKKDDAGFVNLFNGTDLAGFKFEMGKSSAPPDKTWMVKEGVIVCTGKPAGYFYTDKSYKNYVLRYDWRYKRPDNLEDEEKFGGNSGCLVHIQPPPKIWPKCVEVQGMNRNHGQLLFLGVKGMNVRFDKAALTRARHKVGEWNTTEITCKADGTIEAKVNGTPVSSGQSELTEGPIGWQSEGAEIHFRNIKLKQLK